jgi:hypothetical protein
MPDADDARAAASSPKRRERRHVFGEPRPLVGAGSSGASLPPWPRWSIAKACSDAPVVRWISATTGRQPSAQKLVAWTNNALGVEPSHSSARKRKPFASSVRSRGSIVIAPQSTESVMVGAMTEAALATTPDTTSQRGPAAGVTWDLADLYAGPDDPRLEADLAGALDAARRFAERHRSRVAGLDAAELAAAIDELEAFEEPAYRAAAFAQLLFAADTSAPRHGALLQRVQERGTEIRNAVVFFELEWVAIDDARAAALLAAPALAQRRHLLEQMRKYRPTCSEAEERLLEETRQHGPARIFAPLRRDACSRCVSGLGIADGKTEEKSEEEVLSQLYEPDRDQRRRAADSLTRGLKDHSRLLAFVFNTLVQDKATRDRLRHYASPIDERNLANEIDDETVQALMTACERRGALVARYYRLRRSCRPS